MKRKYFKVMLNHPCKNQAGFTLLELILAMSIVAIIVALGLGGVRLGVTARDVGEQKVETYQRLRIISEQLKQKLQSTYPVFITQKDGIPGVTLPNSSKRILAFEGKTNSIRFVTFASPMTASDPTNLAHEVKFYIGEHPETEQIGLIVMERDISNGDVFSRIDTNSKYIKYFVLAENVAQMKFRYYLMKRLAPQKVKGKNKNAPRFSGQWVDYISIEKYLQNQANSSQANPKLEFDKANKISLPRAVEITIGIIPQPKPGKEVEDEELKPVFATPIIVLLNSGMEFARNPI
jgi:prepilin-type N-terminal cleavage/methylation domain-containing protein